MGHAYWSVTKSKEVDNASNWHSPARPHQHLERQAGYKFPLPPCGEGNQGPRWLHECAGSLRQLKPSPWNCPPPTLLQDVVTEMGDHTGSKSHGPQTDRSLWSSFLQDAGKVMELCLTSLSFFVKLSSSWFGNRAMTMWVSPTSVAKWSPLHT